MNERIQPRQGKVYIVDDDYWVRDSMRLLLESVGYDARAYRDAEDFSKAYAPDSGAACVVLDVRLPGASGLELLERLRGENIDVPIIIVTGYADVPMAVRAMKAGAVDFLQKPYSDQTLLDTVHRALERSVELLSAHEARQQAQDRLDRLSPREREVLDRVVQGKATKVIAFELDISDRTVETHRANIMRKMEVRTVPDLVRATLLATEDQGTS
jgi:FixJ family two-component response regulator